jgi:phosphatidylserine decarboxylase
VLDGRPELQQQILDSTLSQFPVIGDEIADPQGLRGSVGAIIVGGIATTWHGAVNPRPTSGVRQWRYGDDPVDLRRGEEMGRFFVGSTVVMLFPQGTLRLRTDWTPGRRVRLGEPMVLVA